MSPYPFLCLSCSPLLTRPVYVSALAYGNEAEVGQGIVDSGVPRAEIFLTSKLDNPWHKRVEEGITTTLKNLGEGGGGYLDLYLVSLL